MTERPPQPPPPRPPSEAAAQTLTGAAATALLAKAVANTKAAPTVVVKAAAMSGGTAGQATSIDLTLVQRVGCAGTIAESKTSSFQQPGYAYVTNSATPALAELNVPGKTGGLLTFTVPATPLTITTPSAAETIDGDALRL